MMIQMNGGQRSHIKYNAIDLTLMNIVAKISGGAMLKIKAERLTIDSIQKSYNIFDTCNFLKNYFNIVKHLLSERNHAALSQQIKGTLGKLFHFKHIGIMLAEKSREGFNPEKS